MKLARETRDAWRSFTATGDLMEKAIAVNLAGQLPKSYVINLPLDLQSLVPAEAPEAASNVPVASMEEREEDDDDASGIIAPIAPLGSPYEPCGSCKVTFSTSTNSKDVEQHLVTCASRTPTERAAWLKKRALKMKKAMKAAAAASAVAELGDGTDEDDSDDSNDSEEAEQA